MKRKLKKKKNPLILPTNLLNQLFGEEFFLKVVVLLVLI
jgi:hypothetical protein